MAFQRLLEDCTFLILRVFKFDFDAVGVKRYTCYNLCHIIRMDFGDYFLQVRGLFSFSVLYIFC